MNKLCFLDVETTGVHELAEIIQISFILENSDSGKTSSFDFKVRPKNYMNPDIYEQQALEKINMSVEEIIKYPEQKIVYNKIIKIFNKCVNKFDSKDKMFIIGYNSRFDVDALRKFFLQNNDEYFGSYFWNPDIDVMRLVAFFFMDDRYKIKNFKLETIAEMFGIILNENKLHDAMYDVEITRAIYNKLIKDE